MPKALVSLISRSDHVEKLGGYDAKRVWCHALKCFQSENFLALEAKQQTEQNLLFISSFIGLQKETSLFFRACRWEIPPANVCIMYTLHFGVHYNWACTLGCKRVGFPILT